MTLTEPGLSTSNVHNRIWHRRIYYLSGFDPRGARFYHQLCQEEAAKESTFGGRTVEVGRRQKVPGLGTSWSIQADGSEGKVLADHLFVAWDDVVRDHWPAERGWILARLVGFYTFYVRSGAMLRLWRLQRRFAWTILTPLAFALMVLLLMVGIFSLVGAVVIPRLTQGYAWIAWCGATAGAFGVGGLSLVGAERWKLFWLGRIFLFVQHWARGDEVLEARWRATAQAIREDMQRCPADEYVLVAHSVGAMVAMPVLAHLADEADGPAMRDSLAVLTYGQVNPFLALAEGPGVDRFKAQVRRVASLSLPWLDLSAPHDALSCALISPFAQTGARVDPPNLWVKSARFDLRHDKTAYQKLRRELFDLHFEYLRATDQRPVFQHFDLLCGPESMAERVRLKRVTP